MVTKKRLPMFFEEDKGKVFCRVREIKEWRKFKALARHARLYSLCGVFLLPLRSGTPLAVIKQVAKRGHLFIWTGDRHVD